MNDGELGKPELSILQSPRDLRARAEDLYRTSATDVSQMTTEDVQTLVQELQIHQIELEMQNEELLRTQRKLAESQHRYADLYDFAPVGCITFDNKGKILEANYTATNILGIEKNGLLYRRLSDFIHPDSQDEFYFYQQSIAASDSKEECELKMLPRDGSPLIVRMEGRRSGNEYKYNFRVALVDITARKEAETALVQLNKNLELRVEERSADLRKQSEELKTAVTEAHKAARIKAEFLANMSHEIRTPLNGIMGMADLLLESNLDADQRELAETVMTCSKSLLGLVNDVLDFSKIEASELHFSPVAFELRRILDRLEKLFRVTYKSKEINFILEVAKDVPEYVITDPDRLEQILVNLIGNSIKFTGFGGTVILLVEALEIKDMQCPLKFHVIDTGIGILEEKMTLIFEPFSQADSTTTRRYGGTGLGLTISRQLAQKLGGDISVRSKEGIGSVFSLSLHLELANTDSADQIARPDENWSPDKGKKSIRILLAEDNLVNARLVIRALEKEGYKVLHALNGREALDLYQKNDVDLVLMDIQMPDMDGVEACNLIKKVKKDFSPPVVALTAHVIRKENEKEMKICFDDYLTKPHSRRDLLEIILKYLPRR